MADNFYKQGSSYYNATTKQKILNPTDLGVLSKAGGKEIAMPQAPVIPQGSQAIPAGQVGNYQVQGQFGQTGQAGSGLYGIPKVPTSMTQNGVTSTPNIQPADPLPTQYDPKSFVDSSQAYFNEVMKDYQTSKDEAAKLQEQKMTERGVVSKLMETIGGKGQDYQNELEKLDVNKNTKQLMELNKQIASANGEFGKAIVGLEGQGRGITTGIIGGQANFLKRQQAAEVGALTSVAQALQGNIELAYQTAEKSINMKYEPLENQLKQELMQLDFVYQDLSDAEKKKADSQAMLLNERLRLIDEQKTQETDKNNLVLDLAKSGADMNTINKVRNAKTLEEAILSAAPFIAQKAREDAKIKASKQSQVGGFTPQEQRMLEAAGLADAPRKEQLAFLYKTPEQVAFNADIDESLDNLANGGDWGTEWNYIRKKYPDATNEQIDTLLRKDQYYPKEEETKKKWYEFWK